MKYYVNDKIVDYKIFEYYLDKSIKYQVNFALPKKELNYLYINYFNDMKYNGIEISFKDKMCYKIRRY